MTPRGSGRRGIIHFEPTRPGCSQRLHRNTVTLVTPSVRFPVPDYFTAANEQ